MQNELTLQEFPMGEMGEIVSLTKEHETAIYKELGIDVGMTVMILHKAVDWLIQVGYTQIHVGKQYLPHIKVKPVAV